MGRGGKGGGRRDLLALGGAGCKEGGRGGHIIEHFSVVVVVDEVGDADVCMCVRVCECVDRRGQQEEDEESEEEREAEKSCNQPASTYGRLALMMIHMYIHTYTYI